MRVRVRPLLTALAQGEVAALRAADDADRVLRLLGAADAFLVDALKAQCEMVLVRLLDRHNASALLAAAEQLDARLLKRHAVHAVAQSRR